MANELHVLFSGKVPTKAALTRAMKELAFPVTIPAGGTPLAQQSGYLPMKLRREESGVEVDVTDDRSVVEDIAGKDVDPSYQRCVSFRWGGDEREMLCAQCTAAALAKLLDGIVRDDDGAHLSADQAIAQARDSLSTVKPAEPRHGTRPADIKRYLKPLLELRSDLVVVGRHLFIRPVRHFLRGALFVPTIDKYRFEIMGYVHPLYSANKYGYDMRHVGTRTEVWQPHFAAQLFEGLKTDVLDRWGPVTTLDGFATWYINAGRAHYGATPVMCLALAGEWDRAAECAERAERELTDETEKAETRELWQQLTTDIGAVCAKLHAREAENVKALKLERIWEPAPFPVELPPAERAKSADPLFLTTPWIPTPPGLWQELPNEPGEVRFAKKVRWRGDEQILLVALSREEAEERHRAREEYVMAARLADGFLLVVHLFEWDRNHPEAFNYVPEWSPPALLTIQLRGHSHVLRASTSTDRHHTGVLEIDFVYVDEPLTGHNLWQCFMAHKEGVQRVHDHRSGEMTFAQSELPPAARKLAVCPMPAFGEYAELVARVRALPEALGYGDIT
jgi:hypothetical protein